MKEFAAYRSFYCGLCRNLHLRYGRPAQMMLNYDLTFLALLHTGLYEPETKTEEYRCVPHPLRKHRMIANEVMDYAADMSVLLSWQKLQDDWEDDHSYPKRAAAALLHKAYEQAAQRWPRQARSVEESIRRLHEAERQGLHDVDAVSGLTGQFLAEVYVWKEDAWQDDLRAMGFYLGKFIYLIDALEDAERDRRKGSYNLFSDYVPIWGTPREAQIRDMLMDMMTEAARAFERLPVLEHAEIIRNILYSGVWCKYAALRERALKKGREDAAQKDEGAGGYAGKRDSRRRHVGKRDSRNGHIRRKPGRGRRHGKKTGRWNRSRSHVVRRKQGE